MCFSYLGSGGRLYESCCAPGRRGCLVCMKEGWVRCPTKTVRKRCERIRRVRMRTERFWLAWSGSAADYWERNDSLGRPATNAHSKPFRTGWPKLGHYSRALAGVTNISYVERLVLKSSDGYCTPFSRTVRIRRDRAVLMGCMIYLVVSYGEASCR